MPTTAIQCNVGSALASLLASSLPPHALHWALTLFSGVVAGWYGLEVAPGQGDVSMVWPASAVGFVSVVLWGPWMLSAIWLSAGVLAAISGVAPGVAMLLGIPAVAEAAVAAALAKRLRLELRFLTPPSTLLLAGVAAAAATVGATANAGVRVMAGLSTPDGPDAVLSWLLGDATGMIAFAPALFSWILPRAEPSRPRPAELMALAASVTLVSGLVLINFSFSDSLRTVPTLLALFPVIIWTSLRADTRVAVLVVVVLSVAGTLGVRLHTGALTSASDTREVFNVQAFHFLVVVLTLVGTALSSQREKALAMSRDVERRLTAVSAATVDVQMLFAVEPGTEFRLVHLNRAALELVRELWPGTDGATLIDRYPADGAFALPGFGAAFLERNLAHGREAVRTRQVVRFTDGIETPHGSRTAEVAMIPIVGPNDTVVYVLRSSVDTSARRAAEEALRRFHEDLERRVAERTEQLALANRELEAFGYTLSHDLRAPLRSVEGFSRAIIEDLDQGVATDVAAHAQRIHAASLRMFRLIDDLLRLSQLPTGPIDRADLDLTRLVEEVVAEMRSTDATRVVAVRAAPGMRAMADARLLTIAMQNLLSNAWKYTARTDGARIEIGQRREGDEVVTWVRDNGVGFDPQYAGRLFSPFERLHKAEDFDGVGIGLATVRRIIVAHGGRAWAESVPGEGATFSFTLGRG